MSKQNVEEIAKIMKTMLVDIQSPEQVKDIIGTANKYAVVKGFPQSKEDWTDTQLDKYFNCVEKLMDIPDISEDKDIISRLSAIMGEVKDITPGIEPVSNIVSEVVDKLEQVNEYRDDLKCPYCKSMVYDNRKNKKSDKSPDFVCSTNDPAMCGGHSGKWRKSWWLDNADIPEEWGISNE